MTHELKITPKYYKDVLNGWKTFEVRSETDRTFHVGDVLRLHCFDPEKGEYTGFPIRKIVTYTLRDEQYVKPGMCILGLGSWIG